MKKYINKVVEFVESVDAAISRKTGYYYAYRVKFTYKNKKGFELFNWTQFIGLSSKTYITDHRGIKKSYCKIINTDEFKMQRKHLCNGSFDFEPLCYVGRINLQSNKKL